MKIRISKKYLFILLLFFVAAVVYLAFFQKDIDAGRLSEDEIIALRSTYRTYDSKPSNVVFAARRTPMELILQATELIVVGEIIEDSGEYQVDIIIDPSDPDYERKQQILVTEGINIGIRYYNDYKIKVHETWYGDPSVKEITGIIPEISLGRTPFKKGLKGVFYLKEAIEPFKGKYWMGTTSFFYLTDTNHILSCISDEQYNKYSGTTLQAFKKTILDMKKKVGHHDWLNMGIEK